MIKSPVTCWHWFRPSHCWCWIWRTAHCSKCQSVIRRKTRRTELPGWSTEYQYSYPAAVCQRGLWSDPATFNIIKPPRTWWSGLLRSCPRLTGCWCTGWWRCTGCTSGCCWRCRTYTSTHETSVMVPFIPSLSPHLPGLMLLGGERAAMLEV